MYAPVGLIGHLRLADPTHVKLIGVTLRSRRAIESGVGRFIPAARSSEVALACVPKWHWHPDNTTIARTAGGTDRATPPSNDLLRRPVKRRNIRKVLCRG